MTRHTLADLFESHAPDHAAPRVVAGRYEVLGLIGVGGMGSVYRARDRELDEVVALKLIRPDLVGRPGMVARFRNEVKLARRVSHENVVRTFDIGECADGPFITMACVDGSPLSSRISDGPMGLAEVVSVFAQVCEGVDAAHRAGVLHLDLKPDNVLVAADGRVLVSDFGLAHALHEDVAVLGRFVGTVGYAAPEQLRGEPLDRRADIYALGVLLFEALTGALAFPGDDPAAVIALRELRPRPDTTRLRAAPVEVSALVQRALSPDRANRHASAAEFAAALTVAAGTSGRATAPGPSAPGPAAGSRWSIELPRTAAPPRRPARAPSPCSRSRAPPPSSTSRTGSRPSSSTPSVRRPS